MLHIWNVLKNLEAIEIAIAFAQANDREHALYLLAVD